MWIAFHLTDRCQLDCRHCTRDPDKQPRDLPLGLIEKVLDEARAKYGASVVALTGGEPTLHPEFPAVLDAIASRGLQWHLVTNGARFTRLLGTLEEQPRRRASLSYVALSVDGPDEATHDSIRGAGSYREVMTAVTLCKVGHIPFHLKTTLHARNAAHLEAMGLAAAQLGAEEISFAMMRPTGSLHDRDLFLPVGDWKLIGERLARLRSAVTVRVTAAEGFFDPNAFHVCPPFAGQQLHVDDRGRLNLCCEHSGQPNEGREDEVAGDLSVMSLVDAHRNLVRIVHAAEEARLEAIASGELGPWDHFPCNFCMKLFGKPHWSDDGATGPGARRERWNGAWDRTFQERRRLRVVK